METKEYFEKVMQDYRSAMPLGSSPSFSMISFRSLRIQNFMTKNPYKTSVSTGTSQTLARAKSSIGPSQHPIWLEPAFLEIHPKIWIIQN